MRRSRVARHLLTLAGGAAAIAGFTLSPPLRDAVIAVEPTLASVLFFAALVGAVWSWHARRHAGSRRKVRHFETRIGRLLDRWGWAAAILCMLAPLLSQWALRPPAGTTAFAALLGYVPWSDARGHFEGGLRLLSEGSFASFSERRPLNAAWLAVQLAVSGGRLPFALVVQAVLLGFAAYLLARMAGARLGLWSGLAVFGLMQGLARDTIPAALTESLAITLGCCALAVLLTRRAHSRWTALALGLFALGVGLDARPGPQFLLPALLFWGIWLLRRSGRTAVLGLCAAAALSFATTRALSAIYASSATSLTGSGTASSTTLPAYALYSLVSDSDCDQVERDLERELAGLTPRATAGIVYRRAVTTLRRDPRPFARALTRNAETFVQKLGANLARIATLRAFFAPAVERARPSVGERRLNVIYGLPFLVAAAGAALLWLRRRATPSDHVFWLAAAAGILGSVPFVYGISGFRCLATAYPFFALFLALGLASRRRRPLSAAVSRGEHMAARSAAWVTLGILALSLTVPAWAHRQWPRPATHELEGLTPGQTLVVALERAPAVLVAHAPRSGLTRVPWVRERELFDLLDLAEFKDADLRSVRLPFALASVYDFVSKSQYLLVGPVDLLRQRGFVRVDVAAMGAAGAIVRDTRVAPPDPADEGAVAAGGRP